MHCAASAAAPQVPVRQSLGTTWKGCPRAKALCHMRDNWQTCVPSRPLHHIVQGRKVGGGLAWQCPLQCWCCMSAHEPGSPGAAARCGAGQHLRLSWRCSCLQGSCGQAGRAGATTACTSRLWTGSPVHQAVAHMHRQQRCDGPSSSGATSSAASAAWRHTHASVQWAVICSASTLLQLHGHQSGKQGPDFQGNVPAYIFTASDNAVIGT